MSEPAFNPVNYVLNLPPMNGAYEAGIAAGGDLSVAEGEKLSVFPLPQGTPETLNQRVNYQAYSSAIWAIRKPEFQSLADWYAKGAYTAVLFGMVGTVLRGDTGNRIPDGDYVMQADTLNPPPTKAEIDRVNLLVRDIGFVSTLTLQIAGKANYYQTNHHTGESMTRASGYTRKCMLVILGNMNPDQVKMVHTISHWCSTIFVLNLAQVPNMREDYQTVIESPVSFSLSADARLRFDSFPSGTARYAVVDNGIVKLKNHELIAYFRDTASLVNVRTIARELKLQGAAAHIGAHYLTRNPRYIYDESVVSTVLGRVGTFLRQFYAGSTLVQSPHLSQQNVESAEDYSPEWKDLCFAWSRRAKEALKNIEITAQEALTPEEIAAVRASLN